MLASFADSAPSTASRVPESDHLNLSLRTTNGATHSPQSAAPIKPHPVLVKHLGFFPMDFVDDVVDAFNSVGYQGLDQLREFVEASYVWPDSDLELETGLSSLETLLEHAQDKQSDIFEMFCLKHAFYISEELPIRLPYEKNLDFSVTEEDDQAVDAELEQLRKEVAAETLFNARLRDRAARLANRLAVWESDIPALERIAARADVNPPLPTLAIQLDQLANLVRSTHPILTSTSAPSQPSFLASAVDRQAARARKVMSAEEDGEEKTVAGRQIKAERERSEAWRVGGLGEVKDLRLELEGYLARKLERGTWVDADAMEVDGSAKGKENRGQ
ncbi:hypothetical protein HDU93_000319 [Gonapodya sp. JEL0774]|nr:hypothetical protein HDU93_000319 [Gonapodya sp. JEL0774]